MTQPSEPNQPNDPTQETGPGEGTSAEQPSVTPHWPSTPGESIPPPPQQPGAAVPPPTAPAPPVPPYTPMPQTSNSAIVALVLAIVSWVVCPVIPAIIALVFAGKADREIAVSNGWVTGGGLVTAAKIVAWINIGLYAALIAIGLIFFLIAAAGGAFA